MIIDGTDWLVIAAGAAAIVWVNWYFFVAGRTPERVIAAEGGDGGNAPGGAGRNGVRKES